MQPFGRLTEVEDIREFWKNEALDFTPWIAANISELSDALNLELEVQASEQAIGPFKADVVCRVTSLDDHIVLIENQLERTDHTHLGQLLTYAAGLDAVTIVWIAKSFAEEHRAALDWLNNHTDDHLRFFGVQVRVWKIGNSLPAVQFDLVSRPNDWSNQARIALEGATTEGQKAQVAFWTALRQYGSETHRKHVPGTSPKANWVNFGVGRTGIHLAMVAARSDPQSLHQANHLRVEFVFDGPNAAYHYGEFLIHHRDLIDSALGDCVWYEVEGVNMRRIYVWREADITDESDWENQFRWLFERIEQFDKLFRPMVAKLGVPPPALPSV